ncbi:hypothetical protein [Flavobacterium sp. XGLA_31]|uniref:hypothetical protein n=1 Tax=Flavobacterium sp. XGLA_31 TaxID=3447666 RepID=UPI003F3AF365
MKRILSLLILLFIFNACDDGNLTVDVIDFSEGSILKCGDKDVLYKVKDNEMLYLEISSSVFTNNPTPTGEPLEIPIGNGVHVVYRKYSANVSQDNLCPTVPSATPALSEQWEATSGTLQITVSAVYGAPNATTNQTKIIGYKYYIVFKNTTFLKPDGTTQLYGDGNGVFVFGNYTVNVTPLALGFDEQAQKSTCDNRIFNFNSSEAFILDVADYATLFANEVTTTPRTALLDSTHKLTYRLYSGVINDQFLCTTPTPTTSILSQEWNGVDGVDNISGIIEVSTTTLGTDFQHTIVLKNVTMKKGNSTFYLGDTYTFGSFITTP